MYDRFLEVKETSEWVLEKSQKCYTYITDLTDKEKGKVDAPVTPETPETPKTSDTTDYHQPI